MPGQPFPTVPPDYHGQDRQLERQAVPQMAAGQRPVVQQQGVVWTSPEKAPITSMPEFELGTLRNLFLHGGILTLIAVVAIPCWNALQLLRDVPYMYFASGSQAAALPWWILWVCLSGVAVYAFLVGALFDFAQPDKITNQALFLIWVVVLTVLGVSLLATSNELEDNSQMIYNEIWTDCSHSPLARPLHDYSQSLHALRAQPSCSKLASIEECEGFEQTLEAEVLKAMENSYRCSGFCYVAPSGSGSSAAAGAAAAGAAGGAVAGSNGDTAPKPNASFIELQGSRALSLMMRQKLGIASAVEAAEAAAILRSAATSASLHSAGSLSALASSLATYPPTLFSEANYKASCDGMAARRMRSFVGDIARETSILGIALIGLTIVSGFVNLFGLCAKAPGITYHDAPSYGTCSELPLRQPGDRGFAGLRYVG